MNLKIGKKIQSRYTGNIATIKSDATDGFITLEFEDGKRLEFAEHVLQAKWTDKIDKNFKPKIEERKTIQLGEKKQKTSKRKEKDTEFPYVMYTWVKYGRKKDALNKYKILNDNQRKALKKYFKENDVKNKHLDFLKMIEK
jgi:hypothetical protein